MLNYIFLGIIQGFTEFLPVSSSGHLVLAQHLMGISKDVVALDVILHLGTVFALVIFFFKDILNLLRDKKTLFLLFLVTTITGLIGISGKKFFEDLFTSPKAVGIALIFTGIVLLITKKFKKGEKPALTVKDGLILGVTQGLAIVPGISRSGMTVSTLIFRKISRQECFRFSFLAAIPVILAAALLEVKHIDSAIHNNFNDLHAGFFASMICGLIALPLLRLILRKDKLYYFGYYCIIVAVLSLVFIK